MVLRFFLLASIFFFISCSTVERDNPDDMHSIDYSPPPLPSSSSMAVPVSSSSLAPGSSSSVLPPPSSSSGSVVYGDPVTYEGETYETVIVGSQTWFNRNLNYNADGSKCYNNRESNCAIYGRLYDWSTAMALPSSCNSNSCSGQINTPHRGICPSGWHLPSKDEWDALASYIQSDKSCTSCDARHLKSTSGWNSNGNGEDTYGFSALPGGYGRSNGIFGYVGDNGYWWCASEYDISNAYGRYVYYSDEGAYWSGTGKSYLFSVRCLHD